MRRVVFLNPHGKPDLGRGRRREDKLVHAWIEPPLARRVHQLELARRQLENVHFSSASTPLLVLVRELDRGLGVLAKLAPALLSAAIAPRVIMLVSPSLVFVRYPIVLVREETICLQ